MLYFFKSPMMDEILMLYIIYLVSKNCTVLFLRVGKYVCIHKSIWHLVFFFSIYIMIENIFIFLLNSVKNHSKRRTSKTSMIKEQSDSMVRGENPMALVFPTVSIL